MICSTTFGDEEVGGEVLDPGDQLVDDVLAEPPADVADATEQTEHERRQRQQHEEAGLRRETGHPVAQADPDRLHRQAGRGMAPGTRSSARRNRALGVTPSRYPGIVCPRAHPRRDQPGAPTPRLRHGHVPDRALDEGLRRWAGPAAYDEVSALGVRAGSAEAREWAMQANENEPVLRTHSPTGERIDEVAFHPAWHSLMDVAVGAGLTAEPWTRAGGQRRPRARARPASSRGPRTSRVTSAPSR